MPYLAFNLNDGNEFIFDLLEERLSLGRNPRNEIVIDNNQISSFHAEFARQPGGAYVLTDLKSSNGTYVNGRRVESAELKPGDKVRFGQLEARFRDTHLPGPDREEKGSSPSAEDKRRDAESIEGPGPQTEFIPLRKAPTDAPSPLSESTTLGPKVQALAPTSPAPVAGATIPRTVSVLSQIVAKTPLLPTQHQSAGTTPHPTQPTVPVPTPNAKGDPQELREQHAALKAGIVEAQVQLQHLRDENEKLDHVKKEAAAARLALETLRQESEAARKQIAEQREVEGKNHERVSNESKNAGERLAGLARDIKAAEERLVVLHKEGDSAAAASIKDAESNAQLGKLASERAAKEKEHAEFIAKLNATRQEVERLTVQRDDRERELGKLSADHAAREEEHAGLVAKISIARQEIEGITQQRNEHSERLEQLSVERAAMEKEHAEFIAMLNTTQHEVERFAGQRADHARELEKFSATRAAEEGELAAFATKLVAARQEFESHNRERVVHAKELEGLAVQRSAQEKDYAELLARIEAAHQERATLAKQQAAAGAKLQQTCQLQAGAEARIQSLQPEQIKLEALIKNSKEEVARQQKQLESEKHEFDEAISKRHQQLEAVERGVAEIEGRRTAAEKRMEELAATDSHLATATKALTLVNEQQSAAEAALLELKMAHEEVRKQVDETAEGHSEARKELVETQQKLSLLQDERVALEKSTTEARAALTGAQRNFAGQQAELQKSHAIKAQEFDAALAAKQSSLNEASKRLRELEARNADLESKTAALAETEKNLAGLRDKISGHETKHAELEGLIAELTSQRGAHEVEIGALSAERERRNSEIKELVAREEELKKSVGTINVEVAGARTRYEELCKINGEVELNFSVRRSELERDLADKESSALVIEERITRLTRREEDLNTKLRALTATESRLKEAVNALTLAEEQKGVLEGAITSLTRQRVDKEHEIAALAEQGGAQHALIQTLSKQRASLEENVATLDRTLEDATRRLAEVESRTAELEGKSAAHQAELEIARAGVAQAAEDLQTHRAEMLAVANAKEKHLAEHKEVKSQHAAVTKRLEETAARHRVAESHAVAAETEAKKQQAKLDALVATVSEKSAVVARLEERHVTLTEAAAKFADEESARKDSLAKMEKQLGENAENLEAKRIELAEAGKRLSAAEIKCLELEQRLEEHREIEQRIVGAKDSLVATRAMESDVRTKTEAVRKEREALHQELLRLQNEAGIHGQSLATLRREHEAEKLRLQQTRDHLELETNRAGGVRNEIAVLLATLASKQKEAQDAMNQVTQAAERLTMLERRANELKDIEQQILKAQVSLDSISKQRLEELQTFDALTARKGALSQDLARIEHEIADEQARETMAAEAAQERLAELAELEEHLAAERENLAHVEQAHAGITQELQAAKAEAESIRATSAALSLEEAATQNNLSELVARRTLEEEHSAQLKALATVTQQEIVDATHRLDALREQCAKGEESLRQICDQISLEGKRLQMAQGGVEVTEKRLADLQGSLGEREITLTGQVAELTKQVESLRREEDGIAASLQTNRERLQRGDASLEELLNKIAANESRYAELLHSGDKLLSLNEALAMMETKERVASRHLSEAAEQELSQQLKLNALNESVAKEQQRLEQIRLERGQEEEDRACALEKAGRDLEEARHRVTEDAKQAEIALTMKLKERVRELEEKHEVLRRSLHANMDEKTVILFANDLIKRIDLIDILIQRVTGPGINGGMDQQLRTLRASFEDILDQHGIEEFKVAPGTEVDVDLRQRIAIVESVSGPARPKVVESYRPGFLYSGGGGREVVLRKVEVKTSSESLAR